MCDLGCILQSYDPSKASPTLIHNNMFGGEFNVSQLQVGRFQSSVAMSIFIVSIYVYYLA